MLIDVNQEETKRITRCVIIYMSLGPFHLASVDDVRQII